MTSDPALEHDITTWLVESGLDNRDESLLLDGMCRRLVDGGLPLKRVATGFELLHPLVDARGCRWHREEEIIREDYERDRESDPDWERSPFHHLLHRSNDHELRRRLDASHRRGEFPLLDRFQDEGITDYLALAIGDKERREPGRGGMLCSFQTDRLGGFRDGEVELLRRLARVLALAIRAIAATETARTLAATYLGADAGRRVLEGAIARGATESVRAVLWYSDLEGFTRIADSAPGELLIGLLNDYADLVVSHIHAHGGQVLKFIGDGILAMFPLDGAAGQPCARALAAAAATLAAVDRLAEDRRVAGLQVTNLHLALHLGDVLYGNIGSRDRLDFTMVGPAVNEVARIEALCRSLDQRVVISSAFAQAAGPARRHLVSLGRFALKGVRRPEELFTLDPDANDGMLLAS